MAERLKHFYEEIKIPTIFSIFATFCCFLSMTPMRSDAGLTVCVLLYILSYVSARLIVKTYKHSLTFIDTVWKKILTVVFFIYFNISIYGMVYLESNGLDGFKLPKAVYPLVSLVWVTPLFFGLLYVVSKLMSAPKKNGTGLSIKVQIIAFLLLMLNYGIWLYAFNPCISSVDSGVLYNQAHQMMTVPMINWHPPFYAIVLSFLLKICDSATFLVILQCIAFSVLIVRMTDYLLRSGCNRFIGIMLYLLWGFSFNNVIQMITLWKDIPYMISLTWLTFLLARFIKEKCNVSKSWYIRFVIAMALTALFRQNGILPAVAVAVFICVLGIIKKKYFALVSVAAFLAIIIIIEGPVYKFYKVESRSGLKYFALANDIVGTYYLVDDPSDDVVEMVNEITENDPENFGYNSYYTTYNRNALGEYSVPGFLSVYVKTFFRHPKELTLQFMRRNSVLWSIIKPEEEFAVCTNYKRDHHSDEYTYSYPKRVPNNLTELFSKITDYLTDNSLVYLLAWRTGIYTIVLIAVYLYAFCKKKPLSVLIYFPIVFNVLGLYAASGWSDYRYSWPIEVTALFIIPFMNCYLNESKTDESLKDNKQG
ncbi:MAG: hypothetical protein J5625_02645 [Lachnospiraceae bacterium]|nr:hypothetical protein [Lachnospiraceae bacterium]